MMLSLDVWVAHANARKGHHIVSSLCGVVSRMLTTGQVTRKNGSASTPATVAGTVQTVSSDLLATTIPTFPKNGEYPRARNASPAAESTSSGRAFTRPDSSGAGR